jgi:hypothetical protein
VAGECLTVSLWAGTLASAENFAFFGDLSEKGFLGERGCQGYCFPQQKGNLQISARFGLAVAWRSGHVP